MKNRPKDDLVTLCFGKCDKDGLPKNKFLMTPTEASSLGQALIGAHWLFLDREHQENWHKEK